MKTFDLVALTVSYRKHDVYNLVIRDGGYSARSIGRCIQAFCLTGLAIITVEEQTTAPSFGQSSAVQDTNVSSQRIQLRGTALFVSCMVECLGLCFLQS